MASIKTNISSMLTRRNLESASKRMQGTVERLSSGKRITKSADDAAGLSISNNLTAQIESSKQALRNITQATSFIQFAEGNLNELSNILVRLRELSISGASDTLGDTERGLVDKEFQQMKKEITRIAESSNLNGMEFLNGSLESMDIQTGIYADENSKITIDTSNHVSSALALGVESANVTTKLQSLTSLAQLDYAIEEVVKSRAYFGAIQSRLESTANNTGQSIINNSAANSRISDADFALQTSNLVKDKILVDAATAATAQANIEQSAYLRILKKAG